jgi:hypothetical protein
MLFRVERFTSSRGDGTCASGRHSHQVGDHAAAGLCPEGFFDGLAAGDFPSRGLGDDVTRVLNATGIGPVAKAVITAVTGKADCGCTERAKALNELAPHRAPE